MACLVSAVQTAEQIVQDGIRRARNLRLSHVTDQNAPWAVRAFTVLKYAKWELNRAEATEDRLKQYIRSVIGDPHIRMVWRTVFARAARPDAYCGSPIIRRTKRFLTSSESDVLRMPSEIFELV